MLPSLRQLEAFVAVCHEGSFNAAAQRISATPSGLSALIRELEAQLGARLFDRTTRRVQLTQAGDVLREPAMRALRDVERGAAQVRAVQARQVGRVTVAAPPLLAAKLLVTVARQLQAAHPGIETRIMDVPSSDIPALVRAGTVDVGVGAFAHTTPDFQVRPLLEGPLYALLPGNSPLAALRSVALSRLASETLVLQTRGSPFREELDRLFLQRGLHPRVGYEANQLSTIFSMVESGFGVSIVPPYMPLVPHGSGLAARPLRSDTPKGKIVMICDAVRTPAPAAEAFCEAAGRLVARVGKA